MAENKRAELFNGNIAAGATENVVVGIADQDSLVITWAILDASAAGNLANFEVRVIEPITGEVLPTVLTPTVVHTNALVGTTAAAIHRYDVRGLSKVQIRIRNANASAKDGVIVANSYWS